MSNAVATKERAPHPMIAFKRDLEAVVSRELGMLDERQREKMKSAAIVAVTRDPMLLAADRASFMMALRMCASHGVIPDGNEAVLQTYNTKVKGDDGKERWVKTVTYLPMIRGIINRVQNSGNYKLFYAEVVHDGEDFHIDTSHGDRRPVHTYDPLSRSGEIKGAYSVAVSKDGTVDTEPMPRSEIDKVRNVAKTKNVWDGWFSEKAKVAVMKRHSKRLKLSGQDIEFILNRDETDFDQTPRDVTPPTVNLAQRLQASTEEADAPYHDDPDTIEHIEAEGHWTDEEPDDAFPGADEWDDGVDAFKAGKPASDCPHDQGTEQATNWLGGWYGAREAAS